MDGCPNHLPRRLSHLALDLPFGHGQRLLLRKNLAELQLLDARTLQAPPPHGVEWELEPLH